MSKKNYRDYINKHTYNSLLNIIDISRIKKIIEDANEIQRNDRIIPAISNFKILNVEKVDSIYQDISDEGVRRSECITHYSSISNNINLLSRREGSIKNYFTNFPWDDLEKAGDLLKLAIREGNLEKYERYRSSFDRDLTELKIRLEYIIKITELRDPKIREILQTLEYSDNESLNILQQVEQLALEEKISDYKASTIQYKILTDIYKDLKFVHPEDIKPRGLGNIRKVTEPSLDSEKKDKILGFIDAAQQCKPETLEGRTALCAITFMIGEIAKNISGQTKQINSDIPFKELKEFRNKLHDLDIIAKAKSFLNCVETDINLFQNIQCFLIKDLKVQIEKMVIPDVVNSLPHNKDNPLPPISYLSNQDLDQIDIILNVIKQALPKNTRSSQQTQDKLNICKDILSGKLPIPIVAKEGYNLQNLFFSIFAVELISYKDFATALYANHDRIANKDYKKIKQDIKSLQLLDKCEEYKQSHFDKVKEHTKTVKCFEEFEQAVKIKEGSLDTPARHTKEERDSYYVNKQIELLISSLEKINQSINHGDNYQTIRETCSSPQFHYSHLFHLLIIGQAIQNLVGKDIFLQNATPKLLIEFEFLKWARNGLMHDLSISEVGSIFSYFNNDLLNLQIKEHGARAYDSNEYLQHLRPEINITLTNIANATCTEPVTDSSFKTLLLKQLEIAYSAKEYEIEKLIIKALGEKIQSNDWYAPHFKAEQLLSKSSSIDLKKIYDEQQELLKIAKKYNVYILGFFGKIVQYGFDSQQNSGIFIKCNSNEDLAFFKKYLNCLLDYRLLVVTDEHLKEYFNTRGQGTPDAEVKYDRFIQAVTKENSFSKIMGSTKLHLAIESNATIEDVQKLLQEECNLDLIYKGYAPVHKTCHVHTKNYQLLQLLLDCGANPNIQDKRGDTLAHYAAEENNVELLGLLQSKGADFTITNHNGYTALDRCAQHYNQNYEAYNFLLQFFQQSIEDKIVLAIQHEDIGRLKKYLSVLSDKNKILNIETDKYGLIGHMACGVGNMEIIKLLVENGCNLGQISKDGATALEEACYADNVDLFNPKDRASLITYLIDEVKIVITSRALHNSLYCSDLEITKLLLNRGADPNSIDNATPLLTLINQPRIDDKTMGVIKLLLQHGADILIHDGYVGNSLHLAAERRHIKIVDLLLNHAKQINQLKQLLQTSPEECWVCKDMNAYQIALKYNNLEIAKMLKEYFPSNEEEIIGAKNIESSISTFNNYIDLNSPEIIGASSELLEDGESL